MGLLTLAATLAILEFGIGDQTLERVRNGLFDLYQRAAPRQVEQLPARIVEIDDATLAAIGPWPWPRTRVAELTRRIADGGARSIGFDMLFPEPDRFGADNIAAIFELPAETKAVLEKLPDPDRTFAALIGRSPVVLGRAGVTGATRGAVGNPERLPIEALFEGDTPDGVLSFETAIANVPDLDEVAAGHGLLNGPIDSDGILRAVPLLATVAGRPTPSFSLELLRIASGIDRIVLLSDDDRLVGVKLAGRTVPVQPDGRMLLHFSQPLKARTVSALDVFRGTVETGLFHNGVVIVGATAVGIEDSISTPVASASFGADIHVQTIESILDGTWLVRPGWAPAAEWLLAVALGAAAILIVPYLTPLPALLFAVLGLILVLFTGIAAFIGPGMLLDAVPALTALGTTTAAVLGSMLLETDRRRQLLRDSLIEERISAAAIDGELTAAREIQFGMLPLDNDLKALPPEVDIGATLEPARSIGGDLFDAFSMGGTHVYFMVGDVTGKGVPAALFMSLTKALSKSVVVREGTDLRRVVERVNAEISRENPADMFVAAVLGVLDLRTGEVQLCNAGQENPIIIRSDGTISEHTMVGGPPLCVAEGYAYPVEPALLAPGDFLVLTTDGVTEARNPAGDLYGRPRVIEALRDGGVPPNADAAVRRMVTSVRGFEAGSEPADDLTVMAVGLNGLATGQ